MAEFKVPELGENVAGGDVTRVLVKVGDTIAADQPVLELETDKATVEVPSSVAGRVTDIKVKPGDKVNVGAVVLVVEDGASGESEGTGSQSPRHKAQGTKAKSAKAERSFRMPRGKGPKRQRTRSWSRPARRQAESPSRRLAQKLNGPRRQRRQGQPGDTRRHRPRPSVRRLAREVGVNIDEVQGTGHGGADLGRGRQGTCAPDSEQHAVRGTAPAAAASSAGAAARPAMPLPDFSRWGEIDRQPMSNIRRTTAERLSHAWNTIPHVTQFDKADITAMEELRRKYREQVSSRGRQPDGDGDAGQGDRDRGEAVPAVQFVARSADQRDRLQEVRATSALPSTPTGGCSSRSCAMPIRRTSRRLPSTCTSSPRRRGTAS